MENYNLAKQVGECLKSKGWMIVTAESCTGGEAAQTITSIAGSSQWFERGFVTYSNQAKMELLGVMSTTLTKFGSVSEQTAREMAEGALAKSKANISLAITGIAGPDGGTPEKPVGLVWFAFAGNDFQTVSKSIIFTGDRLSIRHQAALFALEEVLSICLSAR